MKDTSRLASLLIVSIPLLVILTLAVIGYSGGRWDEAAAQSPRPVPVCGDRAMQDRVIALMLEAHDSAFKEHVANLYLVWMKDERDQPERATAGAHQGISAYVRGRQGIEAWTITPC